MTIKDAATASGLSIDTIRFYEKAGMLPPLPRDARGWRQFDRGALDWLCDLERLRATGMPMAEMRRFAELVHAKGAQEAVSASERLAILERHAERLVLRERDLAACKAFLTRKIAVYRGVKGT
jgi:MerR family transcriptional regulator, aldehyde-responsive regulator